MLCSGFQDTKAEKTWIEDDFTCQVAHSVSHSSEPSPARAARRTFPRMTACSPIFSWPRRGGRWWLMGGLPRSGVPGEATCLWHLSHPNLSRSDILRRRKTYQEDPGTQEGERLVKVETEPLALVEMKPDTKPKKAKKVSVRVHCDFCGKEMNKQTKKRHQEVVCTFKPCPPVTITPVTYNHTYKFHCVEARECLY